MAKQFAEYAWPGNVRELRNVMERAVVFGHSHKPAIETRAGVLFFNPGSAGPRRFTLPVTVGQAYVSGVHIRPEIVHLPL